MNCWAKVIGTITLFLTEVVSKLPKFDIERERLEAINVSETLTLSSQCFIFQDIITRSIGLYNPEQFFEFVRALANNQRLQNLENSLEESRVNINLLVDDIERLTDY